MRIVAAMMAVLIGLTIVAPQVASAQAQPAGGSIRILHAAAGSPSVDVYIDGQKALNSRDYFSMSDPIAVAPGTHEVRLVTAGKDTSATLLGEVVTVDADDAFTIAMIGGPGNLEGLVLEDSTGSVETDEARVRIIHAATAAGPVDVQLAGAGEPFLTDVPFGAVSYVDGPAGTYAFDLIDAQSGDALLRTVDLSFLPGWTYTLVVTGQSADNVWVQAVIDRTGQ